MSDMSYTNYSDSKPSDITNDEDFMDRMGEIKSLLKDSPSLDELKSLEANLLRNKIVSVLKYVMSKIEEDQQEQPVPSVQSAPSVPSAPSDGMQGGKKKQKKQKGGNSLDMNKVGNVTDITDRTMNPQEAIIKKPDVHIAMNVHNPFTVGNPVGYSSVSYMTQSQLNPILPKY